jgi:hypothetical protein
VFSFPLTFDTIVALLLTLGGAAILLRSIGDLLSALEARAWPTAEGVMLASRLTEERDAEGDGLYQARVSYRFTANGQELVGHCAFFGDSGRTSWSMFARKIVAKYPAGARVTVHYDPSKPEQAVLETGVSGAIVAILVSRSCFLRLRSGFYASPSQRTLGQRKGGLP